MKNESSNKVETLAEYLARGGKIQRPDPKIENDKKLKNAKYSFVKGRR